MLTLRIRAEDRRLCQASHVAKVAVKRPVLSWPADGTICGCSEGKLGDAVGLPRLGERITAALPGPSHRGAWGPPALRFVGAVERQLASRGAEDDPGGDPD
jgi:hypothetical protein